MTACSCCGSGKAPSPAQGRGAGWRPGCACARRFMPRVEIVQKHNTAARRLYIRGHNGKIYPYLVMNDACLTESRREERVLQLLRLLNPCLEKRKETTKRHLFFTGGRRHWRAPSGTREP